MIRGGIRTRLIGDSLRLAVIGGLEALGWFDATIHDSPPGTRQHRPVRYIPKPVKWTVPVEPNAIAISAEDVSDDEFGLGGEVADLLRYYIDIYAESDAIGWHLAQDARDLLLGRSTASGRTGPVIDVFDLRQATPSPFTQVDIEEILVDRALNEAREYQNHWFMVRVAITDEYLDEFDATHTTMSWSGDYDSVWQWVQAVEFDP
ncbi:hypothetical protein [Caudovirales GX15bay]|nr:hypothetical protein [Caudovirales GX15bay]